MAAQKTSRWQDLLVIRPERGIILWAALEQNVKWPWLLQNGEGAPGTFCWLQRLDTVLWFMTWIYIVRQRIIYWFILCTQKQACCAGCRRRPSPDEAPPIGKIHHFSKMAVTFQPLMVFWCLSGFGKFLITMT